MLADSFVLDGLLLQQLLHLLQHHEGVSAFVKLCHAGHTYVDKAQGLKCIATHCSLFKLSALVSTSEDFVTVQVWPMMPVAHPCIMLDELFLWQPISQHPEGAAALTLPLKYLFICCASHRI